MSEHPSRAERGAAALVERVVGGARRLLVPAGSTAGEGTPVLENATGELVRRGLHVRVLSANPGSPVFGPPGAVALGRRLEGEWRVERIEALCSLDAARFRLPLVLAAARLLDGEDDGVLLVAAPSVTRGVAASEIGEALREALALPEVWSPGGHDPEASLRPSALERRRRRTRLWEDHLAGAVETRLSLAELELGGAPPPLGALEAWPGRQVALLDRAGRTRVLGEAVKLEPRHLVILAPGFDPEGVTTLLARDARRLEGLLLTEKRPSPPAEVIAEDLDQGQGGEALVPPVVSLASAKVLLVNGVLGDPLLHIRLRHRRRSLLFDLGESARLQGRIVHQVSDVFVTHAHFDHIGGFSWFLRSSIGSPGLRRLWGPPGLARHVEGTISGILWDRIGERGPVFEVGELHHDRVRRSRIQVGGDRARLESRSAAEGVLLEETDFRVRAATLDHGVPVLAFSFEEARALHVRREALEASGLRPGPWLSELKRRVLADELEERLDLPDGSRRPVRDLAEELLLSEPGRKIAYATDLDDSPSNRERLVALARGAHVLYCEASFAEEDRALARATQHLTTRACGEIAAAAAVERLVPFHFSKRYDGETERLYRQVAESFPRVVVARAHGRRHDA